MKHGGGGEGERVDGTGCQPVEESEKVAGTRSAGAWGEDAGEADEPESNRLGHRAPGLKHAAMSVLEGNIGV